MSTIRLTAGEPIEAATPARALALAPLLYSDKERSTTACAWLEAVARLALLRELDHFDDATEMRARHAVAIGSAAAAVFVCVAKCGAKDANGPGEIAAWTTTGGPRTPNQLNHALNALAVRSGEVAGIARAFILNDDQAQLYALSLSSVAKLAAAIHDRLTGDDLRAVAAFHGLTLRECFEAFAATRHAKLLKNAQRHGKVV